MAVTINGTTGIVTPDIDSVDATFTGTVSGAVPAAIDVNASAPADSLAIDASGNVGIGTTSPASALDVVGRITGSSDLRLANTTSWTGEYNGKLQVLNGNFYIQGGASSNNIIFRNASGTNIVQFKENGDVQFNSGYGSAATAYGCRAWVNFNGTGTVAIRASGNVSSISDRGLGRYTVNFSTSMPDTNYATTTTGKMTSAVTNGGSVTSVDDGGGGVYTTSAVSIISLAVSGNEADTSIYAVAVFR